MKNQNLIVQPTRRVPVKNASALTAPFPGAVQLLTKWAWPALSLGNGFFFSLMWAFVGAVSAYDAWLCLRFWDSMPNMERNPICLYLMSLGDGDATIFLASKAAGTVLVLGALVLFYLRSPRLAQHIALGVSSCQFGLLLYLTFWT